MPWFLSLQGCVSAGKTTAAQYVQRHFPLVHISYKNHVPMLSEIKRRGLDQSTPEGFGQIQRVFIDAQIRRREENAGKANVLPDLGPEERIVRALCFQR